VNEEILLLITKTRGPMKIFASFAAGVATLLALSSSQPALAESESPTLKSIADVAPSALSDSVVQPLSNDGTLFNDARTGLRLSIDTVVANRLEIHGNQSHRVLRTQDGFNLVPLAKTDGSVQTIFVITKPTNPKSINFNLDFPKQSSVKILPSGEVLIVDAKGVMIGGISRPWAYDANGKPVKTQFEFSKGKLIQHVFHDSANFEYPIIADPWIGIDLYHDPYVTKHKQGYRINVKPTLWGLTTVSSPTWFAHRAEVLTKLGKNAPLWSDTIQEQFYCHIFGSPAGYPEYNMESWSPLVPWFQSLFLYRCNP
jgi:hypothetical protein